MGAVELLTGFDCMQIKELAVERETLRPFSSSKKTTLSRTLYRYYNITSIPNRYLPVDTDSDVDLDGMASEVDGMASELERLSRLCVGSPIDKYVSGECESDSDSNTEHKLEFELEGEPRAETETVATTAFNLLSAGKRSTPSERVWAALSAVDQCFPEFSGLRFPDPESNSTVVGPELYSTATPKWWMHIRGRSCLRDHTPLQNRLCQCESDFHLGGRHAHLAYADQVKLLLNFGAIDSLDQTSREECVYDSLHILSAILTLIEESCGVHESRGTHQRLRPDVIMAWMLRRVGRLSLPHNLPERKRKQIYSLAHIVYTRVLPTIEFAFHGSGSSSFIPHMGGWFLDLLISLSHPLSALDEAVTSPSAHQDASSWAEYIFLMLWIRARSSASTVNPGIGQHASSGSSPLGSYGITGLRRIGIAMREQPDGLRSRLIPLVFTQGLGLLEGSVDRTTALRPRLVMIHNGIEEAWPGETLTECQSSTIIKFARLANSLASHFDGERLATPHIVFQLTLLSLSDIDYLGFMGTPSGSGSEITDTQFRSFFEPISDVCFRNDLLPQEADILEQHLYRLGKIPAPTRGHDWHSRRATFTAAIETVYQLLNRNYTLRSQKGERLQGRRAQLRWRYQQLLRSMN
ncbi:hypothetical protein TWF481_008148 [Arthrobotrys musiformis]|uniref:Transcription factor domain-containing protein n=1 Tax=Arthrobotrys musiformis TaxID=47236 RepID=A0AAV9WC18_9PEZI